MPAAAVRGPVTRAGPGGSFVAVDAGTLKESRSTAVAPARVMPGDAVLEMCRRVGHLLCRGSLTRCPARASPGGAMSMTQRCRVRTRTAVALVGSAVLLLAVPFAYVAWAFDGVTGLLAFVLPLVLLIGLIAVIAVLARRPWKDRCATGPAEPRGGPRRAGTARPWLERAT